MKKIFLFFVIVFAFCLNIKAQNFVENKDLKEDALKIGEMAYNKNAELSPLSKELNKEIEKISIIKLGDYCMVNGAMLYKDKLYWQVLDLMGTGNYFWFKSNKNLYTIEYIEIH